MTFNPDAEQGSIGGDVADFFGNLERLDKGTEYHDSLNPNGDPYSGLQTPKEIAEAFAKAHPHDLEIMDQRLENVIGTYKTGEGQTEPPKVYVEARSAIKEILEKPRK